VGIEPHIHANGDRAVHEALDAIAESREEMLDASVRISIAHAQLVDSSDYERFAHLGVTAVMAFQWAKPGPNSIDAVRDYLGPTRFAHLEPEGSLFAAHARIAFGSDWTADKLDEWLALKVAITRSAEPGSRYSGRLNDEVPLPRAAAVRAMTFDAAYELHQDHQIGSLEPGKLADLIVLDRNVMKVHAEDIAQSKVLLTMVGGLVVFESEQL
jgi:predicted amidohydrolase YtcJ